MTDDLEDGEWSSDQYEGCPVCLGSGEVSQMDEPAGFVACPECAHIDGDA